MEYFVLLPGTFSDENLFTNSGTNEVICDGGFGNEMKLNKSNVPLITGCVATGVLGVGYGVKKIFSPKVILPNQQKMINSIPENLEKSSDAKNTSELVLFHASGRTGNVVQQNLQNVMHQDILSRQITMPPATTDSQQSSSSRQPADRVSLSSALVSSASVTVASPRPARVPSPPPARVPSPPPAREMEERSEVSNQEDATCSIEDVISEDRHIEIHDSLKYKQQPDYLLSSEEETPFIPKEPSNLPVPESGLPAGKHFKISAEKYDEEVALQWKISTDQQGLPCVEVKWTDSQNNEHETKLSERSDEMFQQCSQDIPLEYNAAVLKSVKNTFQQNHKNWLELCFPKTPMRGLEFNIHAHPKGILTESQPDEKGLKHGTFFKDMFSTTWLSVWGNETEHNYLLGYPDENEFLIILKEFGFNSGFYVPCGYDDLLTKVQSQEFRSYHRDLSNFRSVTSNFKNNFYWKFYEKNSALPFHQRDKIKISK